MPGGGGGSEKLGGGPVAALLGGASPVALVEAAPLYLSGPLPVAPPPVRAASRGKLRPERDQNLVVSYWRTGASDEEHVVAKKAEAAKA